MPTTTCLRNPASRRRRDSGEIGVFEATQYFSDSSQILGSRDCLKEEHVLGRQNLEMLLKSMHEGQQRKQQHPRMVGHHEIKKTKEMEKKAKQPSSPGAKLASFLNLFFLQASSKKKLTKSSLKDVEEINLRSRRTKRSSTTTSTRSSNACNSLYTSDHSNSCTSGFATPPILPRNINTSLQDNETTFRDYMLRRIVGKHSGFGGTEELWGDVFEEKNKWVLKRSDQSYGGYVKEDWAFDYKFKSSNDQINNVKKNLEEERAERFSDASSDLFELKNYV